MMTNCAHPPLFLTPTHMLTHIHLPVPISVYLWMHYIHHLTLFRSQSGTVILLTIQLPNLTARTRIALTAHFCDSVDSFCMLANNCNIFFFFLIFLPVCGHWTISSTLVADTCGDLLNIFLPAGFCANSGSIFKEKKKDKCIRRYF